MATRTITGAKLVDNKANDADSFMVDVGGDTMHLRLYFGDAGETNYKYPERVITQRNSFGLDETADVIALGEKGKGLAMDWLSGKEKWEILTKDERARGKDKELGTRTLASIRFPDKAGTDDEYLVQRLMKAGVLRVGSSEADDIIPGTLGSDFTKQLRDLSPVKPNKAKKGEAITFGPNELMANPLFQKASLEDRVKLIDGYFDMAQNIIDANDDGTSVNDATTMRQIKAKNFELVMANLYQGVHEKLIDKGLGEEEAKQETLRLTSQDGKTDEPSYSYPRPGLTGYDLQTQRAYLENPKLQEEFGRFDSQPKAQQEAMRKLFMSMEEVHGSEIAKTAQFAIDTMKSRALINETRDLDSSTSVFVKDHYDPRVRDKVVVKMQDRKREKEIYLEMDKADYLKDNGVSEIVKRLPERGYLGVVADNVHGFNSMITGSPAAMLAQADRIGGLIGSLPGKATDKLLGDGTAQKIAEMIPWGTDGSPILGNAGDWLQRQLTEPQRFLEKESLVSQDKRTSNLKLRQEAGEKTFFGLVTKGTIAPALGQAAVSMVTTMGGAGLGVKFLAAKGAQAIGKTTAGAAATGATGASLGASFLEIGNQEYKEGVAFGLEPDQALLYSIPIALAQTPTDAIADVFVAGKFAGQAKNTINQLGLSNKLRRSVAFTGRVLAKSAVEGGTEATQAVQSAMGAKAFYDANKEIFDWAQIKEEGALGAIVGANIALISDQGVQAKQKPGKRNIDPKLTKAVFDFIDEADPGAGEVELTNEYVDPASGEALVSPNEFANIVKGLNPEHPLRQFPEKDVFETYRRVTYQGEYELQEEADSNDSERSQDFTAAERAELRKTAFGSVMHDFESGNIEKEDILPKLVEVYQEMIKGNEDLENQSGEYMGLLKNLAELIETGKVVRKVGEAVKPEAVDTSTPDGVAGTSIQRPTPRIKPQPRPLPLRSIYMVTTPEATPAEETNILEHSTSLKDLETLLESEQKKQEDNKKTLIAAGAAVMEANDKGVRFPTLYKNLQDEEAAAAEEVARSEENIKQISEEIAAIKTAERKGIDQLSIPEEGAAAPPRSAEGFAYRKARLAVPDPTRMPEQKAATGFSTPEEGATPPRSTGGFSSRRTEPAPEPAPEAAPEAAPEQSAKRGPAARKSVRGKGRSKADQQKLDEYVATLEYVPSNEARRRGSASPFEATEQSSKEELKEEFFASRDKDSSEKPDILLLAKLLTHRDVTEAFAAKIDNEAQASIDLEDTEKGRRKLLEDAVNKRAKLNDWEDTLKEQYPGDTPERGLIYYLTKLAKEEDVDKALNERFNQAIQERLDPGGEATRERVDLSLPPPYEGPKVITDGKEVKPGSRRYRRLRSVGDVYKQRLTEQGIPTTVTERSEAPRAPISKPKPGSQSNYQVAPNEAMAAVRKLAEATKASMSVFTMSDPKQTSISPHTKGALDVLDVLGKEYKDGAPVKPEASTETAAKRIRETADMKRRPPIGDRDVPKPPTEAFVGESPEPQPFMSLLPPGSQPWEENPSKTEVKLDDDKVVELKFNPRPWIAYLSPDEQNEFADLAFNIKRLNKDLKTRRDAPKAKEEDIAIRSLRTDINKKQKRLQALYKKGDREVSKESEFEKVEAAPDGARDINNVISIAVNKFLEPFKNADLSSWSPADTADLLKLIDETMLKAGDVTVTQKGDKQGARKRVDPNRKKSVIVTWPIAGKSYETKFNDVPLAVAEDATSGERSADASIDNINTVYRSQIIKGLRKAIFKEKSDKAYVWSKPSVKNHYRIPTENEVKAESAEGEIRSNFKDVFGNVKTTQGLAGSPLRYPSKDGLLKQRSGETKSEITAEEALNQRREEDEQTESDGQPLGRGKSLQSWMTPDEAYFAWYESLLESVSTQIGKFNSTIAEAAPEYQIFNPFAQGQGEYKPGQATIGDAMEYIIGKVKVGPAVDIEKTGVPTVDGRTIIKALGEVSSYLPRPRRSMKPTLSSEPGMQNQIEPESLGDFKKRWDSYNKKKLNGATIGMLYKRYLNQGGTFKEAYDMFEMKDGILQPKDSAAELPKGNPVERNMPGHFMNQLNPSLHKAVVQILGKDADQHLRRAYNAYYEVLSGAYTGVTRGDVRDSAVRGLEGKALATARAQGFTPEMLGLSPEVSDGDYQEAFFNAFQTAVERMEVATTETFYDDQNADGNFNADDDVDAINEASTESAFYGARPSDLRLSAFRLNTFMKRVRSGAATGMTLANELLKPTGREPKAFDQLRYSKPWPVEKLETVPTRPQDPVPTPISNLIAELKAIADLNQIIVRAGDPEMNTLGFVPQPKFLGNAVIELHPRVAEEVKGKFVMLEELIHAISYKQNASTIAAKDALDQWNIHAKTADLRKKLGQSPDTISTDDLKELYNNKTISESEYVALYAMSSTQEAVAHSFISPSFATMMSSVGVDVADIINGAFPNKPGLAAAAEAYRNSVYAAIPSDPATILQATMNENNGRRGGSASPYAPTTDQKALSAEAFISDDPLQFLKDNKASITYAEAGYSPEEKQIFDERIDGIRDILLNSNPDLTNELLADRYRAAVSSLFLPTSALKSRSIAWNLAMDLESDKHVKEFRARAQKSKLNVQATTGWVSSQRYTQNLIKRVTRNLNNYKMVKEFFLNLQYGKTNPLSGGGRNTHLSRKGLFDRQVQEKKKQLKLKPEETRFAVFANQLFSIRERSYYENLAESTPDMTADQLEMRAIANNIQFQEASILHKLQIGAKIGVEKIVMDGETEADFLYVARTRQDYANMKAGLQWKPQLKPWVKEMLNQPNQEAAKKYLLRNKVLSPQQDAYRKFIIDEFAKLKPEYRYITEVVRGQEWEGYRDYIPLVVDDAQPQNAKQTGPVNLMDNDIQGDFGSSGKMDALPTSPNDRTGIASSSLQRRGIPMDSQFYYRSPSFSQISSAYGSQSYEIATLAERKLVGAMTKANWSSERPQSTTRPLVDNAERQYLSPDHTVKSKMAAMDNINAVVLAVATKQYNNDRSGSDQHQGLKAFREAQQLGYHIALSAVDQAFIQTFPLLAGWMGYTAGPGSLNRWARLGPAVATIHSAEGKTFFEFLRNYDPALLDRTANSDVDMFKKAEDVIYQKGRISNAPLKMKNGALVVTNHAAELMIAKPEAFVLRPMVYVEYMTRAAKNSNGRFKYGDVELLTTNVDLKALSETQEMVNHIAAASDPADKGTAFTANDWKGEAAKIGFLSFGGHFNSQSNLAELAGVQMWDGIVNRDVNELAGGMQKLLSWTAQAIVYNILKYGIKYLKLLAAAPAIGAIGLFLAKLAGAGEDEVKELVEKQKKKLEAFRSRSFKEHAAAVTYLTSADVVGPALGPGFGAPVFQGLLKGAIDHSKNEYLVPELNKKRAEEGLEGKTILAEANLLYGSAWGELGGPGIEAIASVAYDEDVGGEMATGLSMAIPERNLRKWFQQPAQKVLEARAEKKKQEKEKDPNYKTNLRRVLDAL